MPRLEHESVDGSSQFAGALDAESCIVPVSSRFVGAVGHVTIQNRFDALGEDVDVPLDEPHCATTWFDTGESVVLGHCETAPGSSNASGILPVSQSSCEAWTVEKSECDTEIVRLACSRGSSSELTSVRAAPLAPGH